MANEKLDQQEQGKWSDREIFELEQDRFGAQDYAEVLAKRAATADTPLTIGIYGRWGSGKTSLMRLAEESLGKRKKPLESIWINVWQLSSREELWNAFLQALFTQVHGKLRWYRRWAFDWSLFRERVKWGALLRTLLVNSYRVVIAVTPFLLAILWPESKEQERSGLLASALDPYTGGLASLILGLWLVVAPAVQAVKDKVSIDFEVILKENPYEIQVSELQRLQEQFERLVEKLVGDGGRLVIFIDDLDRCTPNKVPEVLEAIKLFTNTPRCVYLIGLDQEIVRQGIEIRYKFGKDEAAEYLEKIIQIPFHLPGLEVDRISRFVGQDYTDVIDICPTAPEVFAKGMEPNPRQVKRVLNVYRTLWELAEVREGNWEMDPVEPELLAKMVVVQSRFSDLYDHFRKHLEDIPQVEEYAILTSAKPSDNDLDQEVLSASDQDTVKELQTLFEERVLERDREAVRTLFTAGEKRFHQIDPGRLSSYIYLTGTAEGEAALLRPSRQEREALLSNDRARVREQVGMILGRAANEDERERLADSYLNRLQKVARTPGQYGEGEIESASYAQAWFEVEGLSDQAQGERFKDRVEKSPEESGSSYVNGLWEAMNVEGRGEDVKQAISDLLVALGAPLPRVVHIPAGHFQMGSTPEQAAQAVADGASEAWVEWEQPQHNVELSGFAIGKYPVTKREYQFFLRQAGHPAPAGWEGEQYPEDQGDHPVVAVSWEDAVAYCNWLTGMTGYSWRLPTEAEWEKAARGMDGRVYPWGDEFDLQKANTTEADVGGTTPVGQFSPQGDSPYGCADMAGNVWEWCADWFSEDEYRRRRGEAVKDPQGAQKGEFRLLRGGSFLSSQAYARCAYRLWDDPDLHYSGYGFRVALSPSNSEI